MQDRPVHLEGWGASNPSPFGDRPNHLEGWPPLNTALSIWRVGGPQPLSIWCLHLEGPLAFLRFETALSIWKVWGSSTLFPVHFPSEDRPVPWRAGGPPTLVHPCTFAGFPFLAHLETARPTLVHLETALSIWRVVRRTLGSVRGWRPPCPFGGLSGEPLALEGLPRELLIGFRVIV